MPDELKPCPFCGGEAKLVDVGIEGEFQDWMVECPNCHIALLYNDDGCVSTILEAVIAWNRRETMPNEMTFEAAVIEVNRLKSQERMDIDRPRLNAAIDKLIEAARFRIKRKPVKNKEGGAECPDCGETVDTYIYPDLFCSACGQAIDWSDYR